MANTHSLDLELSSSQYASRADTASLSITGDITIEGWIKLESIGNTMSIAAKTNRTVISISYRLSPEYPFPTPPEDCFALCEWIEAHTNELQISPKQIAIVCAYAGATIATTVCLMWRDRKNKSPFNLQLLVMPVIDSSMSYPSYTHYGNDHLLTKNSMKYFFNHYANYPNDLEHPYCLPINVEDFSNLPSATIVVAECDPLHDEGIHYAKLLEKSGIKVNLIDLNGVYHGFLRHLLENEFAQNALMKIINTLNFLSFSN